ncbi:class I adenylate-forming enzyme family protein [Nocardia vaccinii]|uniref:class I adenylate-forming enzyme family protein n=1 Tax=Nocardia vaccinii TaxID=1822 RepID=UPI00082E0248|nr:AMP-binding protein [Nocardia vaccinii]
MRALTDFMRLNARRYPREVAVVDDHGRLTYEELVERAYAVGNALTGLGVARGDRVGVLSGNSIFFVEAYLGALCAGAVPVLYNWRWAPAELEYGLVDSGATTVLVEDEFSDLFDAAAARLEIPPRVIRQGQDYEDLLSDPTAPAGESDLDAINVVIYTGGTTGFPKGVMLTERNVVTNALNEIIDTDMRQGDRTLLVAPMFHAASLACWFVPHFILGARSVLMRAFDERRVAEIVEREAVTNGFLVPNMVRRLVASGSFESYDWSRYERMYVGGASFRMPDKRAVADALPHVSIYYQYGLTEGGPIITRMRPEDIFREDVDGSIGRAFLFSDVTVRDPVTLEEMVPGEVGEIMVRGPNVMAGYLGKPEDTANVFDNGWLHTGDMAASDAEGFLFFHDRSKDMIKSGGENVYSAEVERVLYAHVDVREVAVIGVPSVEWDEEVCAVVALHDGSTVGADELRAFARIHLAGYKVPKRFAFLAPEQIPVNDSGKIIKARLREMDLFGAGQENQEEVAR